MKLHEIKEVGDGSVMLSNGYYLVPDPHSGDDNDPYIWALHRLMQDDKKLGKCILMRATGDSAGTSLFVATIPGFGKQSARTKNDSLEADKKEFFWWIDSMIKLIKEDLLGDLRKARKAKADAARDVWLHRLNQDGSESGMRDARMMFDTEEQAIEHHKQMVKINPGRKIAHNLHSRGIAGLEMVVKLEHGKVTK